MVRSILAGAVALTALISFGASAVEPAPAAQKKKVDVKVVAPEGEDGPARVETRAGTFEAANQKSAELVRKAIAGDAPLSEKVYADRFEVSADMDLP
ncbi:MAG: hypothetical protein IRZ16_14135 [Myxococcaceae bacterium]|nr:hypothetical protein [Myxococcaceae bacterium]